MQEKQLLTWEEIVPLRGIDKDERETTIVCQLGDSHWSVFSSDNKMISKIRRAMRRYKGYIAYKGTYDNEGLLSGYFFEIPIRAIRFANPEKTRKGNPNPNAFGRNKLVQMPGTEGNWGEEHFSEDDEDDED